MLHMQKTYLRIEHVGENHLFDDLLKSSLVFFVFITGVTLGFLISLSLTSSFKLSGVNPNQLVGAAAFSDVSSGSNESDAVKSAILEVPQTPSVEISKDTTPLGNATVVTTRTAPTISSEESNLSARELRLLVTDKQIVIDRINQELERVKNSSVALIAQFDQNCGSWSDACAEPYSKALDTSNSSYADLSTKLLKAQSDLSDAMNALRDATAQ